MVFKKSGCLVSALSFIILNSVFSERKMRYWCKRYLQNKYSSHFQLFIVKAAVFPFKFGTCFSINAKQWGIMPLQKF